MEIYFLRHGETLFNKEFVFQGRIDTELSEEGIEQSQEAARVITERDIHFDRVYTSPFIRTKETAAVATGLPKESFLEEYDLSEISYGPYEGKLIGDSDQIMFRFLRDPYDYPPPDGVESLQHVEARMMEAVNKIALENDNTSRILICSHGIALMALFRRIRQNNGKKAESIAVGHARLYRSFCEKGNITEPELLI